MEDKSQVWRDYKTAVLERFTDYAWLFGNLKKQHPSGDGWVAACCPFHDDHNPSFAFNVRTGRWACFSQCGKGGPLDYVMHTTGASFKDALLGLGDKVGVARPSLNGAKANGAGEPISEEHIKKFVQALAAESEVLEYLKTARGLNDVTIQKYELGWDAAQRRVTIPIRDEHGNLVNVRLYSPSQKAKMLNTKGCGSPPRLYGADELAKYDGKQVILCEGEFDRLILQQNGFMAVTSTHGCTTFRKEWLALFDGKDVVIGYDVDAEGQAAAEAVVITAFQDAKAATVRNLKLPLAGTKEDKDFTDFFLKERPLNGSLFEKKRYSAHDLERLIGETAPLDVAHFAPGAKKDGKGSDLSAVLNAIRNAEHLKQHERFTSVAKTVAEYLAAGGAFFFDAKGAGEFLCLEGRLYTVGNNRTFNTLLQQLGQFNIMTNEGRFVWEYLRNFAHERGSPVRSAGWVYGDPTIPAIYVHTHDEKGRILKIAPNAIALIPNGQNKDNVLLNPSDRVLAFEYAEGDPAKGWLAIKELLFDAFPCAAADRTLLTSLIPLIFLKDFCPAKPLIHLSGSTDSGKTTATKLIGHLLCGEDISKRGTVASFYTDASRSPLAVLDNLEVPNLKGDLLDFLLTGATGIVHEKKKLYTDQEIVRERATSFIMTNGIESVGKPELLSRQWDIGCDAAHHNPRFSQNRYLRRIVDERNAMLSAIFNLLACHVLPNLQRRYDLESLLKREYKNHPKDRTFECLALALIVWDGLEDRLGIEPDLWRKWITAQKIEAEETSTGTNIVLQFLNLFRGAVHALHGSFHTKARDEFLERYQIEPEIRDGITCFEASGSELHHIFTALAKQYGYPRPFENARQLMARLKESLPLIQGAGWEVRVGIKFIRGDRIHWFGVQEENAKECGIQGGLGGVSK